MEGDLFCVSCYFRVFEIAYSSLRKKLSPRSTQCIPLHRSQFSKFREILHLYFQLNFKNVLFAREGLKESGKKKRKKNLTCRQENYLGLLLDSSNPEISVFSRICLKASLNFKGIRKKTFSPARMRAKKPMRAKKWSWRLFS